MDDNHFTEQAHAHIPKDPRQSEHRSNGPSRRNLKARLQPTGTRY